MPTTIPALFFYGFGICIGIISTMSLIILSLIRANVTKNGDAIKDIWIEFKNIQKGRDENQEKCHEFMMEMGRLKEAHDIMTGQGVHNRREGDRR